MLNAARSLVLVAVLAVGFPAEAQDVPLEFSNPDGPDRAEIDFIQHNHYSIPYKATLTVFRTRPYVRVVAYGETYWRGLYEEDLRGLDALFFLYRSDWEPMLMCSGGWSNIKVVWYRGDDRVGSERFHDGSCHGPTALSLRVQLSPEQRALRVVSIQKLLKRSGAR